VWNLIVTGNRMSDEDAYTIAKTLVEKKDDIVKVHKEAESFLARQPGAGPIAGAVPSRRAEVFQGKRRRWVAARGMIRKSVQRFSLATNAKRLREIMLNKKAGAR
jgi:hypothetical protein